VPALVKWPTIHGWMWIGTRKQQHSRALCGKQIEGQDSAGTFFPLLAAMKKHLFSRPLLYRQVIVLHVNFTISDALLWNTDLHSSSCTHVKYVNGLSHAPPCGLFQSLRKVRNWPWEQIPVM
jgi:hypothetical protein